MGERTNTNENKTSKIAMNYIAGLGAGLISTSIGYPLDVARVREYTS